MTPRSALVGLVLAAAASVLVMSGNASAAVISYALNGIATGSYDFSGQPSVAFTDAPITVTVYGDTSTAFTATSFDNQRIIRFSSATLTAGGNTYDILLNPGVNWLAAFDPVYDVAVFENFDPSTKTATSNVEAFASQFATYDGVSNTGPFPVNATFLTDIALDNGAFVTFTKVTNATFSAAVPEPATWAMLLLGFGGLGAMLRRRRQAAFGA
jgi:hypothetical protein